MSEEASKREGSVEYLDVLAREAWWEGLRKLVGFLGVLDTKSVQVPRAADLEFHDALGLLDLHGLRIPSARLLQEVTDVADLLRHDDDDEEVVVVHGESATNKP